MFVEIENYEDERKVRWVCSSLWLLSSLIIALLGRFLYSEGPDYEGGVYYIAFSVLYVGTCFFLYRKGLIQAFGIHKTAYLLGVIFILFSDPLYENDHYRYLWEGKVLLHGENPYVHAPDSEALHHIQYSVKDRIGYDHLSSIYPPLSLLWLLPASALPFEAGLVLLMLMNAVLCYLFIRLMEKMGVSGFLLILIFPYLQKEFIQAVHIDLFAVSFLVLLMCIQDSRVFKRSGSVAWNMLLVGCSYWSKIIGIAVLPLLTAYYFRKKHLKLPHLFLAGGIAVSLPLFLYTFSGGFSGFSGASAFSSNWIWNEGFYAVLVDVLGLDLDFSRRLTFLAFVIYAVLLFARFCHLKTDNLEVLLYQSVFLLFAGMMFFSPVFNGWYAVWFLPFALLSGSFCGVLYAVFSSFAYIAHGHENLYYVGVICSHIWFLLLWVELFLGKQSIRAIVR